MVAPRGVKASRRSGTSHRMAHSAARLSAVCDWGVSMYDTLTLVTPFFDSRRPRGDNPSMMGE